MNIESLEINLLKASEIKDDDIILIKMSNEEKNNLKKEDVQELYKKIKDILKKEVTMYFFPKNISIEMVKNSIEKIEKEQKFNE